MEGTIEVTSMNEPDPSWRFVDAAGHEHRWVGDWQRASLPSLTRVVDHACTDDCDDECYPRSHYECVQCGARVVPQTMVSPARRFVPGLPERPCVNSVEVVPVIGEIYAVKVNGEVVYQGADKAEIDRVYKRAFALMEKGL